NPPGHVAVEQAAEGGRYEDITRPGLKFREGHALPLAALAHPGPLAHIAAKPANVESTLAADRLNRVADGDHPAADLIEKGCGPGSDVPEALNGHSRPPRISPLHPQGALDDMNEAVGGRRLTPGRAADFDRFPGHYPRRISTLVLAVLVHDPRHDPGIGVDIRGRDIAGRADHVLNAARELA